MSSHSRWTTPAAVALNVAPGFRLADVDSRSTPGYDGDKDQGKADLDAGVAPLADLQERLFAQSVAGTATGSVLLVLQAMDTAGKGGIVKHVVGAVDPQGVELASFKKPTAEELSHDFLWRIRKRLPDAGRLGVFDRSHYEDVLIGRVRSLAPADEIERRYGAIVAFEAEAAELGIRVVKVMLHISKDEQRERLASRLDRPDKHWKYNPSDVDERALWDEYMDAYQVALERTSTPLAPWHVVPADRKWYARLAVQRLLIDALADIDPQWPAADYDVATEKQRLAES
ncbi:phosphate--nucleotide phosphotransferase [Microbacterium sp. CSI-V]|uniref:polyphosphate kinase 2 family protein n=1 Tax=unclassified Microbacterium TaxID=2609290 RepID=UPI00097BF350|nr:MULTISPECIES: polyphosphate kinase 2 family protein [unclassified Microbacterium]MXS74395.1 polyphosphate kinase 2 family protein [Microbacterium sp. TL13]ONI63000.1 phosphate--nucleotide phosphotransferase [Microbacterium sp. CSI-V]